MQRRPLALLAPFLLTGCYLLPAAPTPSLSSFDVTLLGVWVPGGTRQPLAVVSPCAARYGGMQSAVPQSVRGTPDCRYVMPRGEVEIDLALAAKDKLGQRLTDATLPVSLRVVPGDLAKDYTYRWARMVNGQASATVKVAHLFGEVRVWAEDAPIQLFYADGGIDGDPSQLPQEPSNRTYATGLSPTLYFEEPTLAKVQIPDGFDNRTSPLVGQFLTIGRTPESGGITRQSCADDPLNDNQPATLVVTGTDPGGFFVTDLTACRQREALTDETGTTQVRVPEPDGFLPGTFGALYIYNYSFPEGLDTGDLLWTLSGSVQEFTGTTQLVFPAWTLRERVRERPVSEWDTYLRLITPYELNLRTCGIEDKLEPYLTDQLCGHNRRNMKMESLESGLVMVRNVRFPTVFHQCDLNGDGTVPFFCESTDGQGGWAWRDCDFDAPAAVDCTNPQTDEEREVCCNIDCVLGVGAQDGKLCAEKSTFLGFGQFPMELSGPGPAEAVRDASLPAKQLVVPLTASPARTGVNLWPGAQVRVWCNAEVHYRFGGDMVQADASDPVLPAGQTLEHVLSDAQPRVAFLATGAAPAGAQCVVAPNTRTRLNVMTKDAIPDLEPDCSEADADPDRAEQCRLVRAATYDVTGHLRHLQPGRPRWLILPRDADDVCCRPGPGMECPRPLKRCQ